MKKILAFMLLAASLMVSTQITYANTFIYGPDVVYKDARQNFTASQILELYSTADARGLEIISDTYTGFGDVPGIYKITLGIKDSFDTRIVDVHVKEIISDQAYAASKVGNDYVLYVTKDQTMSPREIVKAIERISTLQVTSNSGIQVHANTYSENAKSPGTYLFEFTIVSPNGLTQKLAVEMQVRNTVSFNPDFTFSDDAGISFKTIIIWLSVIVGLILTIYLFTKISKKFKRKVKQYS